MSDEGRRRTARGVDPSLLQLASRVSAGAEPVGRGMGMLDRHGLAITIESGDGDAGVKLSNGSSVPSVEARKVGGELTKVAGGSLRQAASFMTIVANYQGTIALKSGPSVWRVFAPGSLGVILGGAELQMRIARGTHDSLFLTWSRCSTAAMDAWLSRRDVGGAGLLRRIGAKSGETPAGSLLARLSELVTLESDGRELLLLSLLHEIVARAFAHEDELVLAEVPGGLPSSLEALLRRVKKQPAGSWSLKEAATLAGYSPFHLSRLFKQLAGFGFPEFVDRCRTEVAVRRICSTDAPVEEIASRCGFGTAQALRESCKEYLGLLPSELRRESSASLL